MATLNVKNLPDPLYQKLREEGPLSLLELEGLRLVHHHLLCGTTRSVYRGDPSALPGC
jgi:hypothetical protein